MFNEFISQALGLHDNFKLFFSILYFSLILITLILLVLFIRDHKKKSRLLKDIKIEELFKELKSLVSVRSKGLISSRDFTNQRNTLLDKNCTLKTICEKIDNFDYMQNYLKSLNKFNECMIIIHKNKIKYANDKFFSMLGYIKKDLNTKIIFDIIHSHDLDIFDDFQKGAAAASYNNPNKSIRLLTKDGEIRWFEFAAAFISENDHCVVYLKDITKITEAENEVIDLLTRYHVLFDYSPTPIIEIGISRLNEEIKELKKLTSNDIRAFLEENIHLLLKWINEIKIININRAIYDFFQIKDRADISLFIFKFFREELKDIFLEIILNLAGDRATYEKEFSFSYSSGEKKFIILKFAIIQNNGRDNPRALFSFTDITEQKMMIKEIQNLSMFQESVIYNANIWLSVYDKNFKVIIWNKAAELISGYTKDEVLKDNNIWDSLYPDETMREVVKSKLHSIISNDNGNKEEFETNINCKDKSTKTILWSANKIVDSEGCETGLIIIGYDYTDKKKMEHKLKYVATHDALTNLYNRAFFEDQLSLMFQERDLGVGIIVLDIDGLKYVNDTLGHNEGDKLIKNFAKILNKSFRPSDVVSRIGGDEFCVLIRNIDDDGIKKILDRLVLNIEDFNTNKKKNNYPLNVSFGYAMRDNGKSPLHVFKKADDMLFNKKLQRKNLVIESALSAIKGIMLEKDSITEEHMERLKYISNKFADTARLSEDEKKMLILATELHDIGKVIIPDEILKKECSLSKDEFEIIKKHSESGYRIAKLTPTVKHVSEFILFSHERWDGRGYPKGLKGEDIPLLSRMLHIIDAYDVMINYRPYKTAMAKEDAIQELKDCSGTQFDPYLVKLFINEVLKKTEKEMVGSLLSRL